MRICLTFPSIRMNSYGCGAVLDEEICNKSQSVMAYIITCTFSYTVFTLPYLLKYAAGKRFVYCGKKLYNFYIALSPNVQKLLNKIFLKFECLSPFWKCYSIDRQPRENQIPGGKISSSVLLPLNCITKIILFPLFHAFQKTSQRSLFFQT